MYKICRQCRRRPANEDTGLCPVCEAEYCGWAAQNEGWHVSIAPPEQLRAMRERGYVATTMRVYGGNIVYRKLEEE